MPAITAKIELADERDYTRLLHAFLACTNRFSHDSNYLEFVRDDGKTLLIRTGDGYLSFGPAGAAESERCWACPVDSGFKETALAYFIDGITAPEYYDKKIESMRWDRTHEEMNE